MLLYDDNIECKITISNSSILSGKRIVAALENIKISPNILANGDGNYINILVSRNGETIDDVRFYYYLDKNNNIITSNVDRKDS